MSLLSISEVFGYGTNDSSPAAKKSRQEKWCPFREDRCNKGNLSDPLGICSFGNEDRAGAVCPNRFLEDNRLFLDAGRAAFGIGTSILVVPEMRILKIPSNRTRKIGKVDFIIAKTDAAGSVTDFAALEVQAVYFSGKSIKGAFHKYLRTGKLPPDSQRRLDYRSSAQKRLIPQLSLKVPVFRRWGKKFFVAVDGLFFASLPPMNTVSSIENSEVTWLVYPLARKLQGYSLDKPAIHHTRWEDVLTALREGQEPTPGEIMAEIADKKSHYLALRT